VEAAGAGVLSCREDGNLATHVRSENVTPTFYKNKNFVQIGVHVKMHIKL
jgi:hypothetical protein